MRRFLGFCPGLLGDLFMMTVAARCLKRIEPDCHLTFVINGAYREAAPIFLDHPHIDRVHILHREKDGFDEVDLAWIRDQRFDHVFNPMQDHRDEWWKHRNQSLEAAHMHGLPTAGDDGKIRLTQWFKVAPGYGDHIAFSPFPSWREGLGNPKAFTLEQAQSVVDHIRSLGLRVLQIGAPDEPHLSGADKPPLPYFESLRHVLGCRFMIMGDSGFNWLLSGYDFPVMGVYAQRYFGPEWVHNIQPINPRARYLVGETLAAIPLDNLHKTVNLMLE